MHEKTVVNDTAANSAAISLVDIFLMKNDKFCGQGYLSAKIPLFKNDSQCFFLKMLFSPRISLCRPYFENHWIVTDSRVKTQPNDERRDLFLLSRFVEEQMIHWRASFASKLMNWNAVWRHCILLLCSVTMIFCYTTSFTTRKQVLILIFMFR